MGEDPISLTGAVPSESRSLFHREQFCFNQLAAVEFGEGKWIWLEIVVGEYTSQF